MNPNPAIPKKPYLKPTLRVYGDIKKVTKSLNDTTGKPDGGSFGIMIKTL